jgi:arsenite methyltransferase
MTADASAELRGAVRGVFDEVAERPSGEHPIPVGRALAEGVGYPPDLLDGLPARAVEAFAGVTFIHGFAEIPHGSRVLDLGCGAGMDALIAAGRGAHVTGVDFARAMLTRARASARQVGLTNVEFREGSAESIPSPDGCFDIALVNGIFNLNPARDSIFRELFRVLQPGGTVFASELILSGPLPEEERKSSASWFA